MIRFGSPVFNRKGEKVGIILLNYSGRKIVSDIKELMEHSFGHLILLNQAGYCLPGTRRDEEWGFMYADKPNVSFAHRFPETWKNIKQKDAGLFYNKRGMYIFDTIYPLKVQEGLRSSTGSPAAYQQSTTNLSANAYYWKIVFHLPQKKLVLQLYPNLFRYLLANGLLTLLIGIGCWLIASSRVKHLQTEQDLKKSEQKFRTIADFSYDWDEWLNPDGSYAYISPSCERISGYSLRHFLDDPNFLLEITHPDDKESLVAHRVRHLDNSFEKAEVYFRITMKSGELRWIWHQCQAVYSEDGEWLGRRTTNRDVTEKQKIETALQRERDMFLQGPVATFTWQNQENWPVEYVSGNIVDIIGYKAEDFLNGSVLYAQCIHPDDLDRFFEEIRTHSKNDVHSFIHQPYRLIAQTGTTVWVSDTTTIIRDDKGEISHYLGYLVDISEQKRQEQLVLETSKQQEELKRLNSLRRMAGAIAHRFNNAMMAVQGNLDLMTKTLPVDSDELKMASDAAQAARGASQVGSMLLSYVEEKAPLLQELSLVELVKESVTALKSTIPHTVTLNLTPPPQPLYCTMDQQQIKEVVENIRPPDLKRFACHSLPLITC